MLRSCLVLAAVAVLAGCGGSARSTGAKTPVRVVLADSVKYTLEGVTLTAAPEGYSPSVSRSDVLALFRKTAFAHSFPGSPTVALRTVTQAAGSGYPAWVLTVPHTKPTALGVRETPDCTSVAVYDLTVRVWTWQFQNCPPHDADCDYGCTPANQNLLDAAVEAAAKLAGSAYYAGGSVDDSANRATIFLARAPQSVITRLQARHPGIYVIHNDAPRPRSAVLRVMKKIDPARLKSQGIDVVSWGPTEDGYLQVGVSSDVAKAQAVFDAMFGPGIVRVSKGEPAIAAIATPHFVPERVHTSPPPLASDLELTRNVPCPRGTNHVGPGKLKRLRAVTAVTCEQGFRTYPGKGQWQVLVRRIALSSVSSLQQYYEQPSEHNLPKGGGCLLNLVIVPSVAFVDAKGRWLVPKTPVDGCGHPLKGLKRMDVRWHVVSVRRMRLLVYAAALAAHCAMAVKDEPAGAIGPLAPTPGGPLFRRTPTTVDVCIYRTPPDDFEVGNFVRGFALDAAQTRRLLSALTGRAPRGSCTNQRLFAVVGPRNEDGVGVELGGCFRVARSFRNYTLGSANPAVVSAVLGVR